MRSRILLTLIAIRLSLSPGIGQADGEDTLRTAREVARTLVTDMRSDIPFELTGTVSFAGPIWPSELAIEDSSGSILLHTSREIGIPLSVGDLVHVTGKTQLHISGVVLAQIDSIEHIGKSTPPPVRPVSAQEFASGKFDFALVRFEGILSDLFRDEIDTDFVFAAITEGENTIYAAFWTSSAEVLPLKGLVGEHVSVVGICQPNDTGERRMMRRILMLSELKDIAPTDSRHTDLFAVPEMPECFSAASANTLLPTRHKITGRIIAIWKKNNMLLRTAQGEVSKIELLAASTNRCGDSVEASGFIRTDLYRLNLTHAVTRPSSVRLPPEPAPTILPADGLRINFNEKPGINTRLHGRTVTLICTVLNLPPQIPGTLIADAGGTLVTIDASNEPESLQGVTANCRIACTGVLILETQNWHHGASFPHIEGITLVPRTGKDIAIIAFPPWWTPARFWAAVGILVTILICVFIWNIALRRRAERRGRELAAEQLAHVTSELKVNERTRLAVELHDALSQTLTGVSMQIDTAAGFAEGKVPMISKCLAIASRTIDACRMELRNTLWDLRSAALDEPSMDAAIRKTLCQNLAGIDLSVRFNVPRETFSDNTAHAILKIIRELAANALRHGHATSLKIAGTIDDGKLLFSVRDNGCGFDPDLAPGIAQGHFGLQGIAERLERLNGEMKIESAPGKGAKVTVSLPIPRSGE